MFKLCMKHSSSAHCSSYSIFGAGSCNFMEFLFEVQHIFLVVIVMVTNWMKTHEVDLIEQTFFQHLPLPVKVMIPHNATDMVALTMGISCIWNIKTVVRFAVIGPLVVRLAVIGPWQKNSHMQEILWLRCVGTAAEWNKLSGVCDYGDAGGVTTQRHHSLMRLSQPRWACGWVLDLSSAVVSDISVLTIIENMTPVIAYV